MRFHDNMLNYTRENARLPTLPAARVIASSTADDGPIFIHLHDGDQLDQPDPSRRPAMREPAIGSDEEDDILDRLQCLERAVAVMAGQRPDQVGEDEVNRFPGDPSEPGNVVAGCRRADSDSTDALPDDPQSINAKNSAYWQGKGGTTTGGSQSLPPSSRKAESGGYLPNATGSINANRRLGTTAKVPEVQGETWAHPIVPPCSVPTSGAASGSPRTRRSAKSSRPFRPVGGGNPCRHIRLTGRPPSSANYGAMSIVRRVAIRCAAKPDRGAMSRPVPADTSSDRRRSGAGEVQGTVPGERRRSRSSGDVAQHRLSGALRGNGAGRT